MELIADILLVAGATGAAFYCVVLSRKLSRLNDLETGVGGAIATLSSQVTEMTQTIASAQQSASDSALTLNSLTARAESVARRLELLVASMHDLPTDSQFSPPDKMSDFTTKSKENPVPLKRETETASLFRSARKDFDEVAI